MAPVSPKNGSKARRPSAVGGVSESARQTVQAVLDEEARRLLDEADGDAVGPPAGSNDGALDSGPDDPALALQS